jgi:hypothetical protein
MSEISPRVYTQDEVSGNGEESINRHLGKRCSSTDPLSETAHRAYTRDGLSGIRGIGGGRPV